MHVIKSILVERWINADPGCLTLSVFPFCVADEHLEHEQLPPLAISTVAAVNGLRWRRPFSCCGLMSAEMAHAEAFHVISYFPWVIAAMVHILVGYLPISTDFTCYETFFVCTLPIDDLPLDLRAVVHPT